MPVPGVAEDLTTEVERAKKFFAYPDGIQPFRAWLGEWVGDILRYDAGCLYKRRNERGDVIALEVTSGRTIIPLVDYFGRLPTDEEDADRKQVTPYPFEGDTVPAFLQIIEGMPWVWLPAKDLIYQPWFPQSDSNYGWAPIETVLISANTDMRFQYYFLQFFDQGTLPAGFMQAPPDYSDPAQVEELQMAWDAIMLGDQAKLRQVRWVPHGSTFKEAKDTSFKEEFPLYLMRRVSSAFGVTANDLGITSTVNRATATTQVDVQFRVGTLPLVRHIEDIINNFLRYEMTLRVQIQFDVGQEKEDRYQIAQAHDLYVKMGAESADEVRQRELGLPVDPRSMVPRYVAFNYGVVPLAAIEAAGGIIAPETGAPVPGTVHPVPIDSQWIPLEPIGRSMPLPKEQPDPYASAVDIGDGTGPPRPP